MEDSGLIIWILIGYPLLFLLGWLASRFDYVQLKLENKESPKAYFKGLNLLLDEQQDEAIDAFIQAVQNDPDTSDLHFALGRLFRKRGEFHRAIRIHQHLLSRGDLSTADHERAQYALAQDFLKAGIINLAQEALETLVNTSYELKARRALMGIYERSREWQKASDTAAALNNQLSQEHGNLHNTDTLSKLSLQQASPQNHYSQSGETIVKIESLQKRHMHFLCETAKIELQKGKLDQAVLLLERAASILPAHPRVPIERSHFFEAQGKHLLAYQELRAFIETQPETAIYLVDRIKTLAQSEEQKSDLKKLLLNVYHTSPSLKLIQILCDLERDVSAVKTLWKTHLDKFPSILAAHQWMRLEFTSVLERPENAHALIALENADAPLVRYKCSSCGFETKDFFWQCPGCLDWDSYPPKQIGEM